MRLRLSSALVALVLALVGATAPAGPAHAGGGQPTVAFDDTCAGVVAITVENPGGYNRLVRLSAGDHQPEPSWLGAGETRVVEWPAEHSQGITVAYKTYKGWKEIDSHDWTNPGWPGDGCTAPEVLVVEDCDGTVKVTVAAGDTAKNWRIGDDERWVDFGENVELEVSSVDLPVVWFHQGEWQSAEEFVERFPALPRLCEPVTDPTPGPTPGPTPEPTPEATVAPTTAPSVAPTELPAQALTGGPQLPLTGNRALAALLVAALLLSIGSVLVWVSRRRTAES